MYVYIYTYIHTYAYVYICIYTHTYIHICVYIYIIKQHMIIILITTYNIAIQVYVQVMAYDDMVLKHEELPTKEPTPCRHMPLLMLL